jgi:aryl-alcohol dehydrogenase-like predicted oxidoreductase
VRTRRLGSTTISAIGCGDLCLGTSAGRGIPARDVEHALHEAITFGIGLVEVAADADSEKLAGQAVREQRARDRVVVATRVTLLAERPGPPGRDLLRERLPAPYLQSRIEASLRATRLDALPLAQLPLHPSWLAAPSWPEIVGTCARLVREGKVLAWGALLDDPAHDAAPALIAEPWLAAVSVVFHLCDRRAAPLLAAAARELTAAREPAAALEPAAMREPSAAHQPTAAAHEPTVARELAILARQPLAGGALAGTLGPGVRLAPRDDRNDLDDAALERIAVAVARLSALVKHAPSAAGSCAAAREAAEVAARRHRPDHLECDDVAELALRYVIDRGAIALPRLHRRPHVLPAIAAASAAPLSADLAAEIDQILDDGG